jgi:hypothetical protein
MVAHARRSRRNVGIMDRLKEQAGEVTDALKEGARAIKEQAAETAGELTTAVKGEAERLVNTQKGRAASRIHGVGWAVHKGAQLLHAGKADAAAQYVDLAARSVEQASKYLEENELAQIAEDAADLVRRYPGVTIGGLLVIGLALGRFIKAGQPVAHPRERRKSKEKTRQTGGARRARRRAED